MNSPRARHKWAAVFPVLVWAVATFFLLGRLGHWGDDYSLTRFGPDPPPFHWLTLIYGVQFWRPLLYLTVQPLLTEFWSLDWVLHLAPAVTHGLTAFGMWRLLRVLDVNAPAAATAGLLFVSYPAQWEIVFWPSAWATALANLLFVALCLVIVSFARANGRWWMLLPMSALAFAIPCLNEQPAAAAPACAILAAAVVPARDRRSAARVAAVSLACVVPVVVYLVLMLATAPPHGKGAAPLVPLGRLPARVSHFASLVQDRMLLKRLLPGAWSYGTAAMREHWPLATVGGAALLAFAIPWWGRWREFQPDVAAERGVRKSWMRAALVVGFAVAVFVLAWCPFVLEGHYGAESRAISLPWLAFLIAVGVVVGRRTRPRNGRGPAGMHSVAGLVVITAALAGSLALVGVQRALQERSRRDQAEAAALRGLVPDPAPGSIFVPLATANWPLTTGSGRFDRSFHGCWNIPWTGTPVLRMEYWRPDVYCAATDGWGQPTILGIEAGGIRYGSSVYGLPAATGPWVIRWERAIPFGVDADGQVFLVEQVVDRASGARHTAPQARRPGARVFTW